MEYFFIHNCYVALFLIHFRNVFLKNFIILFRLFVGSLDMPIFSGADEGNLITGLIYIITGIFGQSMWEIEIYNFQLKYIFYFSLMLTMLICIVLRFTIVFLQLILYLVFKIYNKKAIQQSMKLFFQVYFFILLLDRCCLFAFLIKFYFKMNADF